jgi:hypothetical protein
MVLILCFLQSHPQAVAVVVQVEVSLEEWDLLEVQVVVAVALLTMFQAVLELLIKVMLAETHLLLTMEQQAAVALVQ